MKFVQTSLPGVVVIEPVCYGDLRGFFMETYREDLYKENGVPTGFVQDNHSLSVRGTLRGLHFQNPQSQGKLVRVIFGEVFDVAVDVRVGSPTFGKWHGEILTADNHRQMFIPEGFAHGFCVLSEVAEFEYKTTSFYAPQYEIGIRWDDPELGIKWPITGPILSQKDERAHLFREIPLDKLPRYEAEK